MNEKNYVPKKESMTYAIAALGQGLVYSCMSSYITDFYMNVLALINKKGMLEFYLTFQIDVSCAQCMVCNHADAPCTCLGRNQ